jgi:hypothetical protein
VIKPVSADNLRKTGISADKAGDFRPPQDQPETKLNARKARISGPFLRSLGSPAKRTNGWLGPKESNLDMAISKADALACPREFAEPHFIRIDKPLETREFREPYRIRAVLSSGENCAIRRRMGGLCRLEVRDSNQKSRPILGLVANILAQRTGGRGEAGGGRGTGIEPSSGSPA